MDASTHTPGKVLNDQKKAQGHDGPPFHCEFGRCTDEGEDGHKYCRQHRCQWSPPGAAGSCERVRTEAAFGHGLFPHCLVHKCWHLWCGRARQGEMPHCAEHTCRVPGCLEGYEPKPLAPGSTQYCQQHECLDLVCSNPRVKHTESVPAAAASEEAGVTERTFYGYFCSQHECREEGCYVGVVPPDATFGYGMGYCSYHLLRFLPAPGSTNKRRRRCFRS